MPEEKVESTGKRLYYALGSMFIIIGILIVAILVFVSFGGGPTWRRGIAGVILTCLTFILVWRALGEEKPVQAAWLGILSGMTTWMVVGEISHHFGFVEIEAEAGMILLLYATAITLMLWVKNILPWGFKVYAASFLLNWWGHAVLLPQLYLAEALKAEIFYTTYFLAGAFCLAAFLGLLACIAIKPATKSQLVYYGLWLYALLVTGVEAVTSITEKTFGH